MGPPLNCQTWNTSTHPAATPRSPVRLGKYEGVLPIAAMQTRSALRVVAAYNRGVHEAPANLPGQRACSSPVFTQQREFSRDVRQSAARRPRGFFRRAIPAMHGARYTSQVALGLPSVFPNCRLIFTGEMHVARVWLLDRARLRPRRDHLRRVVAQLDPGPARRE